MMIRKGSIGKPGRNYVLQENEVVWGSGTSIVFNLAMLTKQVWRLLYYPHSFLCARVLRAKYYPDGKLLQTKMKSGSSFYSAECVSGIGLL